MKMLNESDILQAKEFASRIHAGQVRKSSGNPYFQHPNRVYLRAKQLNLPAVYQIIAILHDTYEDGKDKKYIEAKIKNMYGNYI
jgi:(p)ppGpp synthase/HD superfamily hydrolase